MKFKKVLAAGLASITLLSASATTVSEIGRAHV